MKSIHPAEDRNKRLASGNSLGLLHFVYTAKSFSASWGNVSFWERSVLHRVNLRVSFTLTETWPVAFREEDKWSVLDNKVITNRICIRKEKNLQRHGYKNGKAALHNNGVLWRWATEKEENVVENSVSTISNSRIYVCIRCSINSYVARPRYCLTVK